MLPKEYWLNASALSNINSFHLSISFIPFDISNSASLSAIALINSGSSHCFIDHSLIKSTPLHTHSILLVSLWLFNDLQGKTITKVIHEILLHFLSGNIMLLIFYITLLDSTCLVVLEYSWLIYYNLGIDWVLKHITFYTTPQGESFLISTNLSVRMTVAFISSASLKLSVSLVSTAIFLRTSKLGESQSFCIQLSDPFTSISACKNILDKEPLDLSAVFPKYYDFTNFFSKS